MRTRLIVALAVTAAAAALASPAPAGADVGGDRGGSNVGGRYSAWAYYAHTTGGGNVPVVERCTLTQRPDDPAHIEYNVISYDGGETYTVWKDCVLDGENVDDRQGLFPPGDQWDILDSWVVTPADPQEMIDEAIARLNPVPPAIVTDPGGNVSGFVRIPTYLSFDEALGRQTASVSDGPITVEVWADPTGEVTWDTGDGLEACNAPAGPGGECAHVYERSSLGQDATHLGLPAYTITAQIAYRGGYAVYADGAYVGGDDDIGGVQRTAETALAVNEAQAVNRSGR
ncbi:MAG TPA: hypothetical protein VFZ77_18725 [Acidimicrobiales bacterium]